MNCASSCCWTTCLLVALGWVLVASALLFLTWNKVLAALFTLKKAKYWQALLVVATIAVFCAPGFKKYSGCGKGSCGGAGSSRHCPYERGDDDADHEGEPPASGARNENHTG